MNFCHLRNNDVKKKKKSGSLAVLPSVIIHSNAYILFIVISLLHPGWDKAYSAVSCRVSAQKLIR